MPVTTPQGIKYQEFEGDHISIKMFGAKGDGVTDDTAAIQNAIDTAATKGTYLEVPYGNYKHSGTINVGKSIRMYGQTGQNMFSYTGAGNAWEIHDTGFTLSGIIFRSTLGAYDPVLNPGGAKIGLDLKGNSEYYIKDCFFGGGPKIGFQSAVSVIRSGLGVFRDNTISWCNNGFIFEYGSYVNAHIICESNDFFAMSRCGIELVNILQGYFDNNYFESVKYGYIIDNSAARIQSDGLPVLISVGSCFIRKNTFVLLDTVTYPEPRALKIVGGNTVNTLNVYNLHFDDNTCNQGSPSPQYAVECTMNNSPSGALELFTNANKLYGPAISGFFFDNNIWQFQDVDNKVFTTAFDFSSPQKPNFSFPVGGNSPLRVAENIDFVSLFKRLFARALDITGIDIQGASIVLKDQLAALNQKVFRLRKFQGVTFLDIIDDLFSTVLHIPISIYHATGNILIGDTGAFGDDGANKIQMHGTTHFYDPLVIGNTMPTAVGALLTIVGGAINPTLMIHHVNGAGPLDFINPHIASGVVFLIADNAFNVVAGINIGRSTAVNAGQMIAFAYDGAVWHPSL